jgi:AraC family transcriptional regulator of adaptative response/methylated-DNA-[protein]-cysteine methyltransferase
MTSRAIAYTTFEIDAVLGRLLVAATERGVCHVRLGADDAELEAGLAAEFPFAALRRDDAALAPWADAVACYAEGRTPRLHVPLDVRGSRFEQRVWDALRAIPRGATRSYGEVAAALGMPRAARAVGRACARNPVALVVPCHRVVAQGGGLGGYRYGLARKRALLEREGERADARAELEGAPSQSSSAA